jgi:hypothetical protein
MAYISSDTEILTKNGWKYMKSLSSDDLVAFIDTDEYIKFKKPNNVVHKDEHTSMVFIQNNLINILGTPDLMIITVDGPVRIEVMFKTLHTIKVITKGTLDNEEKEVNSTDADLMMANTIFNGQHATKQTKLALNRILSDNILVHNENIKFDGGEDNVDCLYINSVPGPVYGIFMDRNPICIRRCGKCCWVMSG